MKILLKKSEYIDNWYSIVRAEHDGRVWCEHVGFNSSRLMMSERLSPEACIEGDASNMIALAKAIKKREDVSFKRCAVRFNEDCAAFSSPKNSEYEAVVPFESAEEFAEQVLAELAHK